MYAYFPPVQPSGVAADVDSDHDYELVDDTLAAMMKTAQESVMYY